MSSHEPVPTPSPLGDDLPPVQPPSAGFILQLFVVPALIVLAVIGVWTLFGRMAGGEQDWRQLVQELDSSNPHIADRAMFGLAQLLDVDNRRGDDGQHLAQNPDVARALAKSLKLRLDSRQVDNKLVGSQVYLTRSLGLLDVPGETLPVLTTALSDDFDIEVRKGALASIAMVSGRAWEREQPVSDTGVVNALIDVSQESDAGLKRAATFALGLMEDERAMQRLEVLLEDPTDMMTTVNAAIALCRHHSTAGYPVFVRALSAPADSTTVEAQHDRLLILRNSLKAVGDLSADFTPEQRQELLRLTKNLADHDAEVRLRVDAQAAASALAAVK